MVHAQLAVDGAGKQLRAPQVDADSASDGTPSVASTSGTITTAEPVSIPAAATSGG